MSFYKHNLLGKILIVFTCIICCIGFVGCSVEDLFAEEYPEEELFYKAGQDAEVYEYYGKVLVHISHSQDFPDRLQIKEINGDYGSGNTSRPSGSVLIDAILKGHFDKVAWDDYKLFIYMKEKETYYCFDINSYHIPEKATAPTNKKGKIRYGKVNYEYDLKEYTVDEFKELYPNYEKFDWYGH